MQVEEIVSSVRSKLKAQTVPPRILLDRLRLVDEDSRKSSQYNDPNYLPFYYHISKFIQPSRMLQIGLGLGLQACCFLQGAKSVKSLLALQRPVKGFYSPRLALSNLRDVKNKDLVVEYYYGEILDEVFINRMRVGFDLVLVTEKSHGDQAQETLEICWEHLKLDGCIIIDYVESNRDIGEVFRDFCKAKNRECVLFKTRYGTGMIQK